VRVTWWRDEQDEVVDDRAGARWRSSQEAWREAGPGTRGLPTKPSDDDFLVWASKPSPKAQHDGDGIQACREASKRRIRGGIAWLASG
jgi:hypothetical protein